MYMCSSMTLEILLIILLKISIKVGQMDRGLWSLLRRDYFMLKIATLLESEINKPGPAQVGAKSKAISKRAKGLPRVNLQYSKIEKPKKMDRVAS